VMYSIQPPEEEAHDAVDDTSPEHQHRPGRRAVRIGAPAI
jgi:hypothetical protein